MDHLGDTLRRIEQIRDLLPAPTSTLLTMHTLLTVVLADLTGELSPVRAIAANKALERIDRELDARIPARRKR